MKTSFTILMLFVLVLIASAQQNSSPSLIDTLNWMKNTYSEPGTALFQQFTRDGKLGKEFTEEISFDHCNMTIKYADPFADSVSDSENVRSRLNGGFQSERH